MLYKATQDSKKQNIIYNCENDILEYIKLINRGISPEHNRGQCHSTLIVLSTKFNTD